MRNKNYYLALLTVILTFNYLDRIVLGVVLQDIKIELHLTDTELGFLTGIAFALFYSIMGIPIARWADRGNRVTIISLTTGLWSLAVAGCGMAGSFVQLLAIRVGVAVGEAGCIPPAHSLIADYFTRSERPRAAARYMLGLPLALTIGYWSAGWLNELYGWRTTFIIIGLPGIALSALAAVMLKEPRRQNRVDAYSGASSSLRSPYVTSHPSLREVLVTLWGNATFRHLLLCFSVWYFFGYGLLQWQPTFFIRSHQLATGQLGLWMALVLGGGALLGTYLGGEWGSRYAANNERRQLLAVALMFAVYAVFNAAAYLASNYLLAFGLLAIGAVGGNMAQGPILATIQTLVPAPMRAMALAVLYLGANLVGMGLGPLAVGALSDALRPWAQEESLRYALVIFSPGYFWAAWHLLRASRTIAQDLALPVDADRAEGSKMSVAKAH